MGVFWETERPDTELLAEAAELKRYTDMLICDSDFRAEAMRSPERAAVKAGLQISAEDARYYAHFPIPPARGILAVYTEEKKHARRDIRDRAGQIRLKSFAAWRLRQIARCNLELGPSVNEQFSHLPFLIELSSGCSVGCPFCALSAGKLRKVCRADEDTLKLFTDLLKGAEGLIGHAVREAILYYATEPMDTPDYGTFFLRFQELFDRAPITTTAVPMRHPDLTRKIMAGKQGRQPTLQRISLLSQDVFRRCARAFSPMETLYTEFLPRYPEGGGLVRAGRGAGLPEEEGIWTGQGTISCVSGFIVNLAERTVRLSTPCRAGEEWPEGEKQKNLGGFVTAEEALKIIGHTVEKMREMPEENISLRMQPFLRFSPEDPGILENPGTVWFRPDEETAALCRLLENGSATEEMLISRAGLPGWKTQLTVNYLYQQGVLEQDGGIER